MQNGKSEPQALEIELHESIAEGVFSNNANVMHSNCEFVIDFITIMPGMPKGKIKARIVLTPDHIKRLSIAINENIEKFESKFGKIKPSTGGQAITFGGKPGVA